MGNTIKNWEKKQRKKKRELQSMLMSEFVIPKIDELFSKFGGNTGTMWIDERNIRSEKEGEE